MLGTVGHGVVHGGQGVGLQIAQAHVNERQADFALDEGTIHMRHERVGAEDDRRVVVEAIRNVGEDLEGKVVFGRHRLCRPGNGVV